MAIKLHQETIHNLVKAVFVSRTLNFSEPELDGTHGNNIEHDKVLINISL